VPCSEENEAYRAVATLLRRISTRDLSIISEPNQQIEPAKSAFELRAAVSRGGGDAMT
jgi:hypothetical protein